MVFVTARRTMKWCLAFFRTFSGGLGKFIQTGTFDSHTRFETRFCHTGSTNTSSLWFVETYDKSQTSIQLPVWFHEYERKRSFSEEGVNNYWWGWQNWQNRTREMYSPIRRNTRKHKGFRQKIVFVRCKKNRQIIIKEERSKEEKRDKKKLM